MLYHYLHPDSLCEEEACSGGAGSRPDKPARGRTRVWEEPQLMWRNHFHWDVSEARSGPRATLYNKVLQKVNEYVFSKCFRTYRSKYWKWPLCNFPQSLWQILTFEIWKQPIGNRELAQRKVNQVSAHTMFGVIKMWCFSIMRMITFTISPSQYTNIWLTSFIIQISLESNLPWEI